MLRQIRRNTVCNMGTVLLSGPPCEQLRTSLHVLSWITQKQTGDEVTEPILVFGRF
jgi:hypothetical protein